LCAAIADRLGAAPDEARALSQAALLHHVGQLAYDDDTIEIHPRVVEQTVEQLGFVAEVRTILEHSRERWDGGGPCGLSGEQICRGARILSVADRYDQLAHSRSCSENPSIATAFLRNESNGRWDPLMFEILDELAERLEATGADLRRPAEVLDRAARARLVHGERDLQTLYSIERATALPIGLRERLTLIAGLLRAVVPFSQLRVERGGGETFCYGDRESDGVEHTVALIEQGRRVGALRLVGAARGAVHGELIDRVAGAIAGMIAQERRARAAECLTDPATGLPNGRFLRRTLARRIPAAGHAGPGFGLIALHLRGLASLAARHGQPWADRYLNTVASRIAAACDESETPIRLGPDHFIVLCPESRGGELVRRWNELTESVCANEAIRLDAAHACHPLDGADLDTLLRTLDVRLAGSTTTRVVPFRRRYAG
jgi:GGDEF domain-containing protein